VYIIFSGLDDPSPGFRICICCLITEAYCSISVLVEVAKKWGAIEYANVVVGLQLANEPISWGNSDFEKTQIGPGKPIPPSKWLPPAQISPRRRGPSVRWRGLSVRVATGGNGMIT
jgi:hypothetical protein